MSQRELSAPVPEALSVPCLGCKARVGERCRTYISGYELPHSTHEIRQLDVLRAELEAVKNERDLAVLTLAAFTPADKPLPTGPHDAMTQSFDQPEGDAA